MNQTHTNELSETIKSKNPVSTIENPGFAITWLQRQLRELEIPVMIIIEGLEAAGKGKVINDLLMNLDPRGFSMYTILPEKGVEKRYPWLKRFWDLSPSAKKMTVLKGSWYRSLIIDSVHKKRDKKERSKFIEQIQTFENSLYAEGFLLCKIFLEVSHKKQRRRFKKIDSNPSSSWKINKKKWKEHKHYDRSMQAAHEVFDKCSSPYPWHVIPSDDMHAAINQSLNIIASLMNEASDGITNGNRLPGRQFISDNSTQDTSKSITSSSSYRLDQMDLSKSISREDYNNIIKSKQKKLRDLEFALYKKKISTVIVYEGWDAAGKGGNIKRVTRHLEPDGYEVIPIAAPDKEEKSHHYLWRFWKAMPRSGHIAIFDRSWYGRVLVERVEGFATDEQWNRAYAEINDMEQYLVKNGVLLFKFFLHISPDEQLRRFQERQENPKKRWKITEEDWRNREKREIYETAINQMLERTSTALTPWHVVASNSKHYARIHVIDTLIQKMSETLKI